MYPQRRIEFACTSTQSTQSLRCLNQETLLPWLFKNEPSEDIMKTCLYNFNPFKPHFYIVKLGFTGVYNILLIFAKNIDRVSPRQF